MSRRAVYDTMIFFQWAALPESRQHRTIKALYDGSIRICLSAALFDEICDVLNRPELQARAPNLTADRVRQVLDAVLERADWFNEVPTRFTLPLHPDDDHVLNLAIHAKASFLVTWETRLLKLAVDTTDDAIKFRTLAPALEIVTPAQLSERLRALEAGNG